MHGVAACDARVSADARQHRDWHGDGNAVRQENIMKPTLPLACAVIAASMLGTGCDQNTARGDYPDRTEETRIRADDLRRDASQRNQAIDREYDDRATASAFRATQIKAKAKHDRDEIDLERERDTAPLIAKQKEAKAKAEREREQIKTDTDLKLKDLGGAEADKAKADSDKALAEADQRAAVAVASVADDITKANLKAQKAKAVVDEREAKELAEADRELAEAKAKTRERKLAVDADLAAQLDKLEKEGKSRVEKTRSTEADIQQRDQRITQKIRDDLDRDKARNGAVSIDTRDGVVVLRGTVPSEEDRRTLVGKVNKVDGVVRVDDRLSVR
jgi:osmotically-inducible protein OsmY